MQTLTFSQDIEIAGYEIDIDINDVYEELQNLNVAEVLDGISARTGDVADWLFDNGVDADILQRVLASISDSYTVSEAADRIVRILEASVNRDVLAAVKPAAPVAAPADLSDEDLLKALQERIARYGDPTFLKSVLKSVLL